MICLLPNRIRIILIGIFLLSNSTFFLVYSQDSNIKLDVDEKFSELEFNSAYRQEQVASELDSIRNSVSEDFYNKKSGYFDFIHAQLLFYNLELDSSLIYLEKTLSYFTLYENDKWLSKCQLLLGRVAEVSGLMEQAKINYYESIKLSENQHNVDLGFAYVGLARCKRALKENCKEELNMGVKYLTESDHIEAKLFGEFMDQLFDLDSNNAPERLNEIAQKYLQHNMYERVVNVYKVIASSYHAQLNFDSAHMYCDKAIDLCEKKNVGKVIIPALYQFKGVLYYKQKQYNVAEVYFKQSLGLYKSHNQTNRMLYTYNYMHKIDLAKEHYLKAYEDLKEYLSILQETTSDEKMRYAKVLEVNNKVELMKSQLEQLKIKKKASEFMLYLVLVITIALLCGVAVYVYLYQKNKKAKIEELNKEFHNLLIGIGEKQLLEHRLSHSVKKNRKIEEELENSFSNENGDIGDSFDSCYMETINLFTDSFPQLTKTEVRYAVMICLKLPIEVIAKVQNVQPGSIRKAKQRIRTKLNVSDNLESYLQEYREKKISSIAS